MAEARRAEIAFPGTAASWGYEPYFHYFGALPPELRKMIWVKAIPSRIIGVTLGFNLVESISGGVFP